MKTFSLAIATLLVISAVSCRQEDEILSTEDLQTIKIIETNRKHESSKYSQELVVDSVQTIESPKKYLDGEIVPPPRK
ncbi:hypothetical protein [Frigoriflavimonas asaccharolytica]|uniref:Uncharacterized protein n=1 Tax=Frigoriflavimonas asaccharolytica TaxID=2735899 RepID=A0A8J8GBH8_9FLAO|nr:hypothetical protein [Frigoriflavimonas asaccharolytica]NRS93164.1 hypothetical protein [Frigoriflavimonas asaccharolytica]